MKQWSVARARCFPTILLAPLFICCAVEPGGALPGVATADLLRFVPTGFSSLWVSDAESVQSVDIPYADGEGIVAVAIAGRHFMQRGASIYGDCDAVWVWKTKELVAPDWWSRIHEEAGETILVDGKEVFHIPGEYWGPKDHFFAVVDGLFLIRTTRLETMRLCLQGSGESFDRRHPDFGFAETPHDAVSMMMCKPDPPPSDRAWPDGMSRFLLAMHADGSCSIDAETASPALMLEWLERMNIEFHEMDSVAGRVAIRSANMPDGDGRTIMLLWVFGFQTFI